MADARARPASERAAAALPGDLRANKQTNTINNKHNYQTNPGDLRAGQGAQRGHIISVVYNILLYYVIIYHAMLMLCWVMLCYVMLCYAMLCYVILYYVMLCYALNEATELRSNEKAANEQTLADAEQVSLFLLS